MNVVYLSRQQVGLAPAKRPYTSSNGKDGVVVHYLGGGKWRGWGGSCAALWREVQRWHFARGWNDVAYSFAAGEDNGTPVVLEGRSTPAMWNARTAATGPANPRTFAVCVLIGAEDGQPTDAEIEAAAYAVRMLREKTNCFTSLSGHRNWMSTSCPGDPLYARLGDIDRLARSRPAPEPKPGSVSDRIRRYGMFIGHSQHDKNIKYLIGPTSARRIKKKSTYDDLVRAGVPDTGKVISDETIRELSDTGTAAGGIAAPGVDKKRGPG